MGGNRAGGVDIISHSEGADPAAVIYDGIQASKARKADVLICDTAGRLHNKKNLMNELNKIFRVVEREYPEAKKRNNISSRCNYWSKCHIPSKSI